jgi:hypothetical protein
MIATVFSVRVMGWRTAISIDVFNPSSGDRKRIQGFKNFHR